MRRRAFTLVELLIVISLLVMLMGILLPAIVKAQGMLAGMKARDQVMNLAKACHSYSLTFGGTGVPSVVGDPPDTSGNPQEISGAQSLYLGLTGYSNVGGLISPQTGGVATDPANYGSSEKKTFYNPKPAEWVRHGDISPRNTPLDSGYSPDIPVFVGYMFKPARPILYYYCRPKITTQFEYYQIAFKDNQVYCQSNESMTQNGGYAYGGNFVVGRDDMATTFGLTPYSDGYLILNAGPDGVYFTPDDLYSSMK